MCFTLVEIYEKFAGQNLAEVKLVVIVPEIQSKKRAKEIKHSEK